MKVLRKIRFALILVLAAIQIGFDTTTGPFKFELGRQGISLLTID